MQDVDMDDDEQRFHDATKYSSSDACPRCIGSVVEVCQRHPLRSPRQPLLRYNGGCTQVTSQGDRFMTAYSKLIEKNVWSSRDIELTYVDNKIVSISISLSLEDYKEKT